MASSSKMTIFELIADPKATQTLPSLRVIVDELTQVMGKPTTPAHAISSLIRRDQSMAVRILRLANSAYFAPSEPILNIEEALLYLGVNQIRSSILTAKCIEQTCNISDELMSWKQFWNHSVAVGCISRLLSTRLENQIHNGETYYVMGLLHDIGKLALAHLSAENFEMVLSEAKKRRKDMSFIEFKMLGIDHAGLGAWYLQQQGLPAAIFETVRLHHSWQVDSEKKPPMPLETRQPEGDEQKSQHKIDACIVALANRFTHHLQIGQSGSEYNLAIDPYKSPEWQFFAEHSLSNQADQLQNYVSSEIENLHLLVEQLTS